MVKQTKPAAPAVGLSSDMSRSLRRELHVGKARQATKGLERQQVKAAVEAEIVAAKAEIVRLQAEVFAMQIWLEFRCEE